MRTAKLEPFAVDVICPHCNELVENSDGGLMWEVNNLEPGQVVECSNCPESFKIPSKIGSVRLVNEEK